MNNLKEILIGLSENKEISDKLKGELESIGIKFSKIGLEFVPEIIIQKKVEQLTNIVKSLHYTYKKIKDLEINRPVGPHKWTPLYRAGRYANKIF